MTCIIALRTKTEIGIGGDSAEDCAIPASEDYLIIVPNDKVIQGSFL